MIVPSGAMYVTRNEFNTALALVGCAQKNMGKRIHMYILHCTNMLFLDLSLVKVYQHRNGKSIYNYINIILIKKKN